MHGVTVEMRNRENNICLRGQGHWNESVSFSREAGDLQHHFGKWIAIQLIWTICMTSALLYRNVCYIYLALLLFMLMIISWAFYHGQFIIKVLF